MANRIEKKSTFTVKDKAALKINPSATLKKAPSNQIGQFEPAPPARTTKNLTRFKKSHLI
ncbi:MAG TPA: hypothetical protein VFX30_13205 [bacterium]|nr:hypothetical protein [bacterium]